MANELPTLLDIAKRNAADLTIELLDEAAKANPEVGMGAARTIRGQLYKTLVRTGWPTVTFRNANEGTAADHSKTENRLVETYILNPQWECDKAVADRSEDGTEAYIADEADATVSASIFQVAKCFYYGNDATFGDAKGFPGLLQAYDSTATTGMVVDAGGTTANTGSSVWAVTWGEKFVQWVWGQGGNLELSDVQEARLTDTTGNPYDGYRQSLMGYPGLQVRHSKCVGRIKKITADSGKRLTDLLIYSLLAKFPAKLHPDVLFMTLRSLEQLRASRTATNPTGAPAPYPEYIQGRSKRIPILVTEALVDTESLTL